jgi:hypothetical protein
MSRQYTYVGLHEIAQLLQHSPQRTLVQQAADVLHWIKDTGQPLGADDSVTATFIVDLKEQLWIADRHSEHVACAAGQNVLAAGEITFCLAKGQIRVSEITNQSTGYCPDLPSWTAVAAALDRLHLPHPPAFTTVFVFRRCTACGQTNIVKEDWFECAVCSKSLSCHF